MPVITALQQYVSLICLKMFHEQWRSKQNPAETTNNNISFDLFVEAADKEKIYQCW